MKWASNVVRRELKVQIEVIFLYSFVISINVARGLMEVDKEYINVNLIGMF